MPLVLHKDFLRASLAALLPLLGPAAIAIAIAIPGPLVAQGRPRRKLEHQVRTWKPLQWLAPVTNDVLILVDGGARQRRLLSIRHPAEGVETDGQFHVRLSRIRRVALSRQAARRSRHRQR